MYYDFGLALMASFKLCTGIGLSVAFLLFSLALRLIAARPWFLRKDPADEQTGVILTSLVLLLGFTLLLATREPVLAVLGLVCACEAIIYPLRYLHGPIGGGKPVGPGWEIWLGPWGKYHERRIVGAGGSLSLFHFFVPSRVEMKELITVDGVGIEFGAIIRPDRPFTAWGFCRVKSQFETALHHLAEATVHHSLTEKAVGGQLILATPLETALRRTGRRLGLEVDFRHSHLPQEMTAVQRRFIPRLD